MKIEQLSCSNLRHLGAMVDCALRPGVIAVCKIFHINDESKLVIDIICDNGKTWTKGETSKLSVTTLRVICSSLTPKNIYTLIIFHL